MRYNRGMRTLLSVEFFKNVIGFATILCFAIGVVALADFWDSPSTTPDTQVAGSVQE